jgi:hypothetical protein
MIYKVSYVILGGEVPGAIINQDRAPVVGEKIDIMNTHCEVTEVQDLLPPQGDFAYLHVTCRVVEDETA